jgi:RNA polymerase sigma-70 factor, ECF subfamily
VSENAMDISLMTDPLDRSREQDGVSSATARLIVRAQAGDETAFDEIVAHHQHRVTALAWRLLGNQDDARDAAQEAFLRVFKHLHKIDPTREFSGWLYRIVINVCRDLGRKRSGQTRSFEAELESGALTEPLSPSNTETAAIVAEQRALLLKALAILTTKERAALVLRDLEGFSTEEVARILGSSPTTVRSQISFARVKIEEFRVRYLMTRGEKTKPRP